MKEYKVKVNGNEYKVEIEEVGGTITNVSAAPVQAAPQTSAPRPAAASAPAAAGGTKVTSPLPGVILDVAVKEGDSVLEGDVLVVIG